MFTGLIEGQGRIVSIEPFGDTSRLTIDCQAIVDDVSLGASIAINGCCLTVVSIQGDFLSFDVGRESLQRTTLGSLEVGSHVNLERALAVGTRLGGHYVTGHIDGVGMVSDWRIEGDWVYGRFVVPEGLVKQIAEKGSIAIEGVSLTVVSVDDRSFEVMLVPHTLSVTTLGRLQPGSRVNLETDILAKYVERQLSR